MATPLETMSLEGKKELDARAMPPGGTSLDDPSSVAASFRPSFIALPVLLLGLGGLVAFGTALVLQRHVDAVVAALVAVVCLLVFSLQCEHGKLVERLLAEEEHEWAVIRAAKARGEELPSIAEAAAPSKAPATAGDDLDLTGFAGSLGIGLRGNAATLHQQRCSDIGSGGTLQKLLLNAMAKEYLRCVSALKCYQVAFGALEPEAEPVIVAASRAAALVVAASDAAIVAEAKVQAVEQVAAQDIMGASRCSATSTIPALSLAVADSEQQDATCAAGTPRSPQGGPPSPANQCAAGQPQNIDKSSHSVFAAGRNMSRISGRSLSRISGRSTGAADAAQSSASAGCLDRSVRSVGGGGAAAAGPPASVVVESAAKGADEEKEQQQAEQQMVAVASAAASAAAPAAPPAAADTAAELRQPSIEKSMRTYLRETRANDRAQALEALKADRQSRTSFGLFGGK